jgi:hypothetical protein
VCVCVYVEGVIGAGFRDEKLYLYIYYIFLLNFVSSIYTFLKGVYEARAKWMEVKFIVDWRRGANMLKG